MIYEPMNLTGRYLHHLRSFSVEMDDLLHLMWQASIRIEFWHECNATKGYQS